MKKAVFTLCLVLTVSWLWAQDSDPKLFTGNTAIQEKNISPQNDQIYLQIGNPVLYTNSAIGNTGDGDSISIRFPWDVPYIPLTFDESFFEISKGYYSDKVQLDWTIQANAIKIDQIKIYRREYKEANTNDVDGYTVIATLSSDSYTYNDTDIQGGVLYEYKVEAIGVSSIPKKYVTYITGVGYRNPTGVVTGNISFDGGSPVKDVVVRADPQGGDLAFGNSLLFTDNSALVIPLRNKELSEHITLQAWFKLDENSSGSLFQLKDNQRTTDEIDITYATTPNSITITTAHSNGQFKTFTISGHYPTGNVDGRGDDLFNAFTDAASPQTDFAQNFVHISVVMENGLAPMLYINGRKMDQGYLDQLPQATTTPPNITATGSYVFSGYETAEVTVGNGLNGNIDEIRLWNKALAPKTIRTDFKRYLGGNESNLISYLRCDEKAGQYAYDISKVGFEFNKNHGLINNGTWTNDKPTSSQLGILGVTDTNGNYIISSIPFSGTGESYTITPLYGVHQFEPSQQLVFVGNGSEVINKIDFKDISSFDFLGVVAYSTHGVFAPIQPAAQVTPGSVSEAGYNQYRAIINGNEQLVSKKEYYYDVAHDTLYETPKVFVAGANIYIDGEIVLDKNKRPVTTDEQGFFKIKVPIGNHYIEVKKNKHSFTHNGRFPAARQDGDDLFEFFEHQQSAVTFIDTTHVSLVGRVVGGTREAEKPIGFGFAGLRTETYNPGTPDEEMVNISSVNNIGQATITLDYLPFGGTPGIGELSYTFNTNEETGEYKVSLLPLSYTIDQANGIKIQGNTNIKILEANETLNISEAKDTTRSKFEDAQGITVYSEPFHFEKSFTYRSTPVLNVVAQTADTEVLVKQTDANGNPEIISYSTEGFAYPLYTQGVAYSILFETYEEYVNYDAGPGNEVFDRVPVSDGEFNITNNLALANSESITVNPQDQSMSTYIFRAGLPSISAPFTKTIDIKYRVNGKDYDAQNYTKEGIILGGQSDGSQTFVTQAPDVPDIILRDPPGSNSFASIEKGKSISLTQDGSFTVGQESSAKVEMKLGTKFAAGGGLAGPLIEAEAVNSISAGLSLKIESAHGKSITKTYTFNQTISTSDDPAFVGSDGDLYIGNTKNYYYGSYDNVQVSKEAPGTAPALLLTNANGKSINISKQKAFYFAEEPSETFFIYSQKFILETLIPQLEDIIEGIDLGNIVEGTGGVLNRSDYVEQIRLWKKVIQDNEKTKYLSLYKRDAYKQQVIDNINKEIDELNGHLIAINALAVGSPQILAQSVTEAALFINNKKTFLENKLDLLESEFMQNVSFDAGVGAFTKSSEIMLAQQKTRTIKLNLDASLEVSLGFKVNETGLILHTSNVLNTSINTSLSENESESTKVTYTLKDNDPNNFLSVDVINAFDGNGPIFSTVGGRTSCPYEGIDTTRFFNFTEFQNDPPLIDFLGREEDPGTIYTGGDQISYATQKVEVPKISVEVASVTDVPEERAAEFTLILENNSSAEADANFKLFVDNTTNPDNALINIEQNGTVVFVPYGQKVEYALTLKKSISDVYEYKDIKIVLASLCDENTVHDSVRVSAIFKPSCTAVEIDAPLNHWVFNAGDAYNPDNSTNPLNISMFGYDRSFNSFEKFSLEYRKSTSSSWTRLQTYYNTQDLLDEAILQGEDKGTLITANTSNFAWDIGALGLSDGEYELRLVSNCSNDTKFISNVVSGTVDLNVPEQFGTPSPTDGILGAGEDLRLQFSEPVLYSSALSKIEILGETNQQDIDHNVSIYFEGADNTITIEQPNIIPGDFSMEFWLLNSTQGPGVIFEQKDALNVSLANGELSWTLGNQTLSRPIASDVSFHHYTLTYSGSNRLMKIYRDDQELGSLANADGLTQRSEASLLIGGNTFKGNLHDLRFWSKPLTLSEAYAAQFNELMGSERDLIGYWPMNEGNGTIAHDLARFKHGQIKASWDIKPKGTSYTFQGGQYLTCDDVNFVQLSDLMDVTLSFWVKTEDTKKATIFSNGRGNGDDLTQSNGKANKWSVSLENGILYLYSEGNQYILSSTDLADNQWHHAALILRRTGSLKTYIDAQLESSNPVNDIGGLSGNKFWIGARGYTNSSGVETVDEPFTGKLDELRLWNMARSTEQVDRDRFNEVDFNAIGLMLYARMNEPDPVTGSAPEYYHKAVNETVLPSFSKLNAGSVSYSADGPKIKQVRPYLSFSVSHVINGDEMIITPLISDWSVLEGQIIDITVDRMFDVHGNRQSSPITWSAFVRRNEVKWFVEDGTQQLSLEKKEGEPLSFKITLVNSGGKEQPYSIENIPTWLSATNTSGTLLPTSSKIIEFSVAPELTIGHYDFDLFLNTDFNFDEKILVNLRVLGTGPQWEIDPGQFEYSMNIVGKIKIDDAFVQDPYTQLAAFVGDELRGVANLTYDTHYDEYFLFLTVYSNVQSGETVTFKIWDASRGQTLLATMDDTDSYAFIKNDVLGYKSAPVIFENSSLIEQNLSLNRGWTWVSFHTEDPNLKDLNTLTAPMDLANNDLIKSQLYFDLYSAQSGWNGSISGNGGLNTSSMYKVKLAKKNRMILTGAEIGHANWSADLKVGWNWLAYPLNYNVGINNALALYQASDGDLIKSQSAFAVYDPQSGWVGTMKYLEVGKGYMLKASLAQQFKFPRIYYKTHGRTVANATPSFTDWHRYENNMNVIAKVVADNKYDTVWVIDESGNARGKAEISDYEGNKLSFITIFGDAESSEKLHFFLSDENQKQLTYSKISFTPNQLLGSLKDPLLLEVAKGSFSVYPNSFDTKLHIQLTAKEAQEVQVILHDIQGHELYRKMHDVAGGFNQITIEPHVEAGLYLLNVQLDGETIISKVIKK